MITLEQFMRESNWIEGERDLDNRGKLYEFDIPAAEKFLASPLSLKSIQDLHADLSKGRPILRGRFRDCDVTIGGELAPSPNRVGGLMYGLFMHVNELTAFEAHNQFEKIHPFEDLNGRTGRLLWLHKMGGKTHLPFLQAYYYQSLSSLDVPK